MFGIPPQARACISAVAVAGTTTTSVLVDRGSGKVLAEPILYNQPQNTVVTEAAAVSRPLSGAFSRYAQASTCT